MNEISIAIETPIAKRRDAFVSALKASPIANQITIMGANAGLHFLLQVQNGMSEAELIASAKANGICLQGISPYYLKNRTPHGAYHSVRICTSHTRRITASCQFTGLYMENLVVASVFSFHKLQYTPFSACKYDICF